MKGRVGVGDTEGGAHTENRPLCDTIATDPYFSDVIVDVTLNATAEEIRDSLQ